MEQINVFWFRRDLRLDDNVGLAQAFADGLPVLPIFIFDKNILESLENKEDARVTFIYDRIKELKESVTKQGGDFLGLYDSPVDAFKSVLEQFEVKKVFTNKDFEPYAKERDEKVANFLESKGIEFIQSKDHVIFEPGEVLKDDGTPYTVYTPFSRKWKKRFESIEFESPQIKVNWAENQSLKMTDMAEIGFSASRIKVPPLNLNPDFISNYGENRDVPSKEAGTNLGPHLRFGTISVRKAIRESEKHSPTLMNEIIWREFFIQILHFFPHVVNRSFREKYDRVEWENNENHFEAWCEGKTGYPMVDAGMRELKASGRMHNRVRMITAGFLCKHLLLDWRWGEAWFAQHLLDFELASNNGNWQWAAGTGCDSAPYFRVFNPETQFKKFDPRAEYVKKWVPKYGTNDYPEPIVEHKFARERAINRYKRVMT